MTEPVIPPPGWADDELSRFFETSAKNEWATFAALPELWRMLKEVDRAIHSFALTCMVNIKDRSSDNPSGPLLLCNAHNHFRAALRLCSSGHTVAVYPSGRAALESALYGWYLIAHPDAVVRWHDKPDGGDARRKWGSEFSFRTINSLLEKVAPDVANRVRLLHEESIAFGSHPNTDALYSNIKIESHPQGVWVGLHFLHEWDAAFAMATRFVSSVGLVSLEIIIQADPAVSAKINLAGTLQTLTKLHQVLAERWWEEFNNQSQSEQP